MFSLSRGASYNHSCKAQFKGITRPLRVKGGIVYPQVLYPEDIHNQISDYLILRLPPTTTTFLQEGTTPLPTPPLRKGKALWHILWPTVPCSPKAIG